MKSSTLFLRLPAAALLMLVVAGSADSAAGSADFPPAQQSAPAAASQDTSGQHAPVSPGAAPITAEPGNPGIPDTRASDPAFEARVRDLSEKLRCPVCQSSSIQESPSSEATEMKAVVRERLAAGESEEEIIAYFVSKYGEWVLLEPPKKGFNLLVYLLPVALLLGGGFFVYRNAKRWVVSGSEAQSRG